jgi:hypothetical protein
VVIMKVTVGICIKNGAVSIGEEQVDLNAGRSV